MKRWLQKLGKVARVAALCGTIAWLMLLTISPQVPDAAHPERYAHRHDVRYVSEGTELALRILLGASFTLALLAFGCHFATKDMQE
ncbi:hypothetical protein A5906_07485 [Bradyrhizobium sacchari]|uniref:Uncharacterized protein n=1 Tax=Bradyrhizobium sacchari TaxID=1399419 RepID=A0A560KL92_9BRAD|nr:hypothetical protein [Bradyrhizobium sacchari]OPY95800.1 hypothetical protein A5906_07485 [Bradyrhizobium sacchari]TWB66673.1 hypothetical protein FBZ94_101350 [Bradyrhizobium sacchari]TWB83909.1 hypothetical protein FBZ95_101349 [Bradyrhizobium sacchari]